MSGRLYSFLPKALIYFVIGMGACGGLTYTMFHHWRNISIVETAFENANGKLPDNKQPMDALFKGSHILVVNLLVNRFIFGIDTAGLILVDVDLSKQALFQILFVPRG